MKGKVIEVFLPEGEELTKVGFKVQVKEKVITIMEEQSEENCQIYREDEVAVVLTKKNGEERYTILPMDKEEEDE